MSSSNTGFSESLIKKPNSSNKTKSLTEDDKKNVCKSILNTVNKTNDKYKIPSQFPILTTNTKTNKKSGGRKKEKH